MIIGIDPGLSGAVAMFNAGNGFLVIHDMPTVQVKRGKSLKNEVSPAMLALLLEQHDGHIDRAFIEQVGAMPGQGVTSMFSFGRSVGMVEGVLASNYIPTYYVSPQTWQKAVGIKGKNESRARAAQLFPRYADYFSRVKDDGRADAALIAFYGETEG